MEGVVCGLRSAWWRKGGMMVPLGSVEKQGMAHSALLDDSTGAEQGRLEGLWPCFWDEPVAISVR